MSNYYDNSDVFEARGIDYDLFTCLQYNPQEGFSAEDIKNVLAVWEGENDGDDWRWVLELNNGTFIFLQGGCDYTGWDCQSWATHIVTDTPEKAAMGALGDIPISNEQQPGNAGLGHLINLATGEYGKTFNAVYESLLKQLAEGKARTWDEMKSFELGLTIDVRTDQQKLEDRIRVLEKDFQELKGKLLHLQLMLVEHIQKQP